MRFAVWCIILLTVSGKLFAQQKPHYTQYVLNQYIINPALTGIENYIDLKISHRQQWVGIQDAPVTSYLSVHGALNKEDYRTSATSFEVEGENPRGNSYWEQYTAAEPHHGIGFQAINDRTGPFNHLSVYGTYAYHIGISARTSLAAGFGAGITNTSLNTNKLDFGNGQTDPALAGKGTIHTIKPDFMAGLYLYSADYFIGLSAQQIIQQKMDFSNNAAGMQKGNYVPHVFATAGYRLLVGNDFNLVPSVLVKYIRPLPVQVEMNAKLQYQDLLWLGAGYRHHDGISAMVGLKASRLFTISYSYDYTTSKLNLYSKGTHEILIGFLLGNKFSDACPRNVW